MSWSPLVSARFPTVIIFFALVTASAFAAEPPSGRYSATTGYSSNLTLLHGPMLTSQRVPIAFHTG